MDQDVLREYVLDATRYGDVNNVILMTIHDFDMDDLLRSVRDSVQKGVRITVNTSDLTKDQCTELKRNGVSGAYHALRMGEGECNRLSPAGRIRTWRNLMNAGIQVSCGTEPIGPEHTAEEIVDNYLIGIREGCLNGGAGMRVSVPGTPFGNMPMISAKRMQQISSTLSLSSTWYHSESPLNRWDFGFSGGGNKIYAEYAGNPRDTEERSEKGFGHTVEWYRRLMFGRSFKHILRPDGSVADLDLDYLRYTGSL